MKTKADLERLAKSAGATLEEDEGYRDMRVFQIVAPDGKRWVDGGCMHVRIDWAQGRKPDAVKFNDAELLGVPTIVVVGRGLADGVLELKDRRSGERSDVPLAEIVGRLTARL